MNDIDRTFLEIATELQKAINKYPTWPSDPLHALAVLGEEYGELNQAMLQLVYEPSKQSKEHVKEEAVQTAAMCIRLIRSLNEYHWLPSQQHRQSYDT